jgi:hypothetical protein
MWTTNASYRTYLQLPAIRTKDQFFVIRSTKRMVGKQYGKEYIIDFVGVAHG